MKPAVRKSHNTRIEKWEKEFLPAPQCVCPLVHRFAPGVYLREVEMPAGIFVIGHEHKTEHFNVVLSGKAFVMVDDTVELVAAPAVIKSSPGVRKVLYIVETMRWMTVHPTKLTDLKKLEAKLITKSASRKLHDRLMLSMMKQLQNPKGKFQ
jgi:hypothetical protein